MSLLPSFLLSSVFRLLLLPPAAAVPVSSPESQASFKSQRILRVLRLIVVAGVANDLSIARQRTFAVERKKEEGGRGIERKTNNRQSRADCLPAWLAVAGWLAGRPAGWLPGCPAVEGIREFGLDWPPAAATSEEKRSTSNSKGPADQERARGAAAAAGHAMDYH